MAPAGNQRAARSGKRRTHERGRLLGQRAAGKPAFAGAEHPDLAQGSARAGRDVELGLEAKQLVELVRIHFFELRDARQAIGNGDGEVVLRRGRTRKRLNDGRGRLRRARRRRRRGRGSRPGRWCRRRLIEDRRKQRFGACQRERRGQNQRGAGKQVTALHCAASGKSTGCSIRRGSSRPPSIQANASTATTTSTSAAKILLRPIRQSLRERLAHL